MPGACNGDEVWATAQLGVDVLDDQIEIALRPEDAGPAAGWAAVNWSAPHGASSEPHARVGATVSLLVKYWRTLRVMTVSFRS
jgi:hypothetical protein